MPLILPKNYLKKHQIMMKSTFLIIALVLCLASYAYADVGLAIYYKPNQYGLYTPSACYGNTNKGSMVGGVSEKLWGGGKACGRRYRVSCVGAANEFPNPCKPNSYVDITVIDYCASICYGDINLSKAAFQKIANPIAGKVRILYTPI